MSLAAEPERPYCGWEACTSHLGPRPNDPERPAGALGDESVVLSFCAECSTQVVCPECDKGDLHDQCLAETERLATALQQAEARAATLSDALAILPTTPRQMVERLAELEARAAEWQAKYESLLSRAHVIEP